MSEGRGALPRPSPFFGPCTIAGAGPDTLRGMAKQLLLSEGGQLQTHEGDIVSLADLLGVGESTTFTQTYSTATTTVPDMTSSAASGGDSPTEAEHNALRNDVIANRQLINGIIDFLQELLDRS